MNSSISKSWVGPAVLCGITYFLVGVLFGELAKWAGPDQTFAWRLAAWIVSVVLFVAHIGYEHFRLQNKPATAALHVALGAGLGALLLAVAATLHMMRFGSTAPYWLYLLALVLWPLMTAVPAFVVAFVAAKLLALTSSRAN